MQPNKAQDLRCAVAIILVTLAAGLAGGCASKASYPVLDWRFLGTWVNANPDNYNWWVLEEGSATNYGIALNQGRRTR